VQDFIREVRTTHDATILLCTHDMNEAELLSDRVGILDRGRLIVLAPAGELKERYGANTLEEAFFAATGRSFEEEDEDAERGVFA
jgi:ABC-2 type transport system ATP-binding protein